MTKTKDRWCHECGEKLASRYYQDVPGAGDLCILCHNKWKDERDRTIALVNDSLDD